MNEQASSGDKHPAPNIDAELDREIQEALGDQSVEQLMEQSLAQEAEGSEQTGPSGDGGEQGAGETPSAEPRRISHDIRRARISAVRGEDVFVDLVGESGKLQGVVPLTQFDRAPRVGAIMDFVVDRVDEKEGLIFLSREGAVKRATWEQLSRGSAVEARCIATNKGGLDLEMVGGIRAFMPASQIDTHHVDDLEQFVGQKLEAMVQEIDRKSKRVVLSRRELLHQRQEAAKARLLEQLTPGDIVEGRIRSIVDFGAFVDLGGVDGLIHVSDLSYTHVDRPKDVVSVGQTVKVKVLKVEHEKERIGLGLKQVEPDPWDTVANTLTAGEALSGRVVRLTNFGAFVEVSPGVEGLLPVSEISWKRIGHPKEVLSDGQVVHLKLLNIDPDKRRMTLSLKQASGDPWIGAEGKYPQNSLQQGRVISTTDFGAFVELETGVEGLVHISELADRRVGKVEDVLKVGDVKEFRILEIDEEERKVKLSLKAATEAAPSPEAAPHKPQAAKRQKPKNLKPGIGKGDNDYGMGMGLGDLKL